MTDFLRKSLAPITDGAWRAIEEQAALTLKGNLALRAMVDFSGPHGLETAALNTGRVKALRAGGGIACVQRETLPLIEARRPFKLRLAELDAVDRGGADPDLAPVAEAARALAIFEENVLLNGMAGAGIRGLTGASPHKPVKVSKAAADQVFEAAVNGILMLEKAGINGPYALALGDDFYQTLRLGRPENGYPLIKRLGDLLEGGPRWSPAVNGGLLLSRRGGDFEIAVGHDLAVGYQEHDAESVTLFLFESFTFRVLEPAAAVALEPAGRR